MTEPEQHGDELVNDVAEAELKQQFEDMLASPLQLQQGEEVHQVVDAEIPGADAAIGDEHISSTSPDFDMPMATPKEVPGPYDVIDHAAP